MSQLLQTDLDAEDELDRQQQEEDDRYAAVAAAATGDLYEIGSLGSHQNGDYNDEDEHVPRTISEIVEEEKEAIRVRDNSVVVKIGLIGDAAVGKTTLMVKYVEGKFDEDYIQTLGVNFLEKTVRVRDANIVFSIWDLGAARGFLSMMPLVCNEAAVLFFMFDLSRISTLFGIKEWYRQARGLNRRAIAFLVGTKYDVFAALPDEEQVEIDKLARKYSKAMKAPLVFSSASHSINVQKLFKVTIARLFDLQCTLPELVEVGEPLLIYK